MFGQVKDIYKLKKQADEMKKRMEKIKIEVSQDDFEVVMRGDKHIESILEKGEEREDLKKLFNKAVKESQKAVAKKMRGQMGDLGLPGM